MINSALYFLITFIGEYGIVCFFCLLFIGGGILFLKENKNGLLSRKTTIITTLVFIVSILTYVFISYINPNYTCLGYSTKYFSLLKQEQNILTFTDECGSTHAKERSTSLYRLQGLNCDNGELLYQKPIKGYHNLIGFQNTIVWFQSVYKKLDIKGFDLKSGNAKTTINEDYLAKTFPDLSIGVYSCDYNSATNLFNVVSKDANHTSINILSGKKNDSLQNILPTLHYEITTTKISDVYKSTKIIKGNKNIRQHLDSIRDKQLKSNLTYAELDNEYEKLPINENNADAGIIAKLKGEEQLQLYNNKDELLNKELHFLKGEFILFDSLTKNIFILSYRTLDKLEFTINCLSSINGELIWKANKEDLKIGDFFIKNPTYIDAVIYKTSAIFIFEGFVLSLNKDSGFINWCRRL